jgi:hypothetical protein
MDPRFIGPNAVWASIAQAFMILLGYTAACLAAAVFAAFAVIHLDPVAVYTSWPAAVDAITFIAETSARALVGGFWASAAAIVLSEGLKWRGPVAYLLAGSLVGLVTALPVVAVFTGAAHDEVSGGLVQLSVAAGAVGGFVYWLIAGRNAGRWLELPWFEENRS